MKAALSEQKLRGGYYTPAPIAEFLASWCIQSSTSRVLEPSCGDGNLLEAAVQALLSRGATKKAVGDLLSGVEFDVQEASKSTVRLKSLGVPQAASMVQEGDFFVFCQQQLALRGKKARFDAVIGNPPFIRYQNFPEEHRTLAFEIMREAGLSPNRLTNSWVPFLIASSLLLSERGRIGMIIPAELFQVGYAAEIRQFLSDFFHRITIVTFKRLVFDDIQQEIVLLLGEKENTGEEGIRIVEFEDARELNSFSATSVAESELKPLDHSTEKWTKYFLDTEEIALLRELRQHPQLTLSGSVLDVDVGVVTGDNTFFVLTEEELADNGLSKYVENIVTRSNQLAGVVITPQDFKANTKKGASVHLLRPPEADLHTLPKALRTYIRYGEGQGVNQGYKCRIRKRWFIVPSVWSPDAFMLRQVHGFPKLVLNQIGATCTDTIHRVRFLPVGLAQAGVTSEDVTAAFLNSLTFAFSEVVGRSYGGGVMTFEPSECERLPLPLVNVAGLDFQKIDGLMRKGEIEKVLDETDRVLLRDGLGLDKSEIHMVRGIWNKLRDRRIYRRKPTDKAIIQQVA